MAKPVLALVLGLGALGLAACASGPYGPPGPVYGPVALADCGGFYDDFYGPFEDGCWGDDGAFWWRSHDGFYRRDEGHHFSHTQIGSMHAVHGVGPGAGAHFHVARAAGGGRRP